MKYLNPISSLIFTAIGYYVLFFLSLEDFSNLVRGEFLMNTAYMMLIYLAIQGLGFVAQKPGTKAAFLLDLLFSILPLFLVGAVFISIESVYVEYNHFRNLFLLTSLIDVIIFTIAGFILAIYTDLNAKSQ